jgi:hypothetical protein
MRVTIATLALTALASCVQVVQRAPDAPPPRTPDPYLAEAPGDLVPTDHPGLFQAPELGRTCYTYEPDRSWYRFAYSNWYQAFRWDGEWFLLLDKDVPKFLAGRVPKAPERPRERRLDDLERELEEIDRREREERERLRPSPQSGPRDAPSAEASPPGTGSEPGPP